MSHCDHTKNSTTTTLEAHIPRQECGLGPGCALLLRISSEPEQQPLNAAIAEALVASRNIVSTLHSFQIDLSACVAMADALNVARRRPPEGCAACMYN